MSCSVFFPSPCTLVLQTVKQSVLCVMKYAGAVKQKVWNEAENGERDWGETLRDWSKSIGGGVVDRSREGVRREVLSLVQGVGRAIFSYPQEVGHPILSHRQAHYTVTNETVDHTCYIKHSQQDLLLKYSQTCCVRKCKG